MKMSAPAPPKKKEKDIFRDTPVRLLGYANEVGESFRAQLPLRAVHATYGVAFGPPRPALALAILQIPTSNLKLNLIFFGLCDSFCFESFRCPFLSLNKFSPSLVRSHLSPSLSSLSLLPHRGSGYGLLDALSKGRLAYQQRTLAGNSAEAKKAAFCSSFPPSFDLAISPLFNVFH